MLVFWNRSHFHDKMVMMGRFGDSCWVWTSLFTTEILSFLTSSSVFSASLCLLSIFPFLPLSEGYGGSGGVMGDGLLPSICCDGRLGSPEGASAWPDRNHHWSVWHQASPQLRVLIRLLVDPQRAGLCSHCSWQHTEAASFCSTCPDLMFVYSVWTAKSCI